MTRSEVAAAFVNVRLPVSETIRNATPTSNKPTTKCTICGWNWARFGMFDSELYLCVPQRALLTLLQFYHEQDPDLSRCRRPCRSRLPQSTERGTRTRGLSLAAPAGFRVSSCAGRCAAKMARPSG